ncbi:MAG: SH3 domain-containing protein [Lachnospiraceae bacterium]|jgi:cell wall-associated NlpC family hydrolase|nr:SH3 domain-containing protein [Lachnospiraceae bacterium]
MKHRNAKLTACVLTGAMIFSVSSMITDATSVSSFLPAAGLALVMEEGSTLEEVKAAASAMDAVVSSDQEEQGSSAVSYKVDVSGINAEDDLESETEGEADSVQEVDETGEAEAVAAVTGENTNTEEEKIIEDTETAKAARQVGGQSSDQKEKSEKEDALSEEEKEFSKLVIAKVNDYVNIRSMPSEEGEILGKLYDKSVGNFIQEEDGWYKITSGNVTGYVKGEYCVTGEEAVALAKEVGTRVATVTTTTLKVREAEGVDAPVLGLVPIDEELSVIEELDGWVKVDIEEGYGYVSSEFVSLRTDFVKAESREEEEARLKKEEEAKKAAKEAAKKAEEKVAKDRAEKEKAASAQNNNSSSNEAPAPAPAAVPASGGSDLGNAVVDYAMQFVGNPYVYGGSSLTNGTDCSGFVMSVYKNFGVSLPHSSSADRSQGYDVGGLDNAQPGDIVCYSGHVGIYAGNGQIVHASTSKTGIIVSNANYRNVLAVRRIF